MAQLVERNLAKVEVAGSNPVFRSINLVKRPVGPDGIPPAARPVPLRPVVGQRTLDPLTEVRILEGQPPRAAARCRPPSGNLSRRRTQVVKGEVCKTSMQRFESARRLHISRTNGPLADS